MREHLGHLRSALAGALITVLVAGCGGNTPAEASDPPGTITIEMGNYFFNPSTVTLKAGQQATVRFKNTSALAHDFAAGRQLKGPEAGYSQDFFKDVKVDTSGGTAGTTTYGGMWSIEVAPLGTARVSFTVPDKKGSYEMGCFLPNHYVAGMKGTLTVE